MGSKDMKISFARTAVILRKKNGTIIDYTKLRILERKHAKYDSPAADEEDAQHDDGGVVGIKDLARHQQRGAHELQPHVEQVALVAAHAALVVLVGVEGDVVAQALDQGVESRQSDADVEDERGGGGEHDAAEGVDPHFVAVFVAD